MKSFWRVTSLSKIDNDDHKFVSSMEAYNYPFFATSFMPDMPAFNPTSYSSNKIKTIQAMENFVNVFTGMSRSNPTVFKDVAKILDMQARYSQAYRSKIDHSFMNVWPSMKDS